MTARMSPQQDERNPEHAAEAGANRIAPKAIACRLAGVSIRCNARRRNTGVMRLAMLTALSVSAAVAAQPRERQVPGQGTEGFRALIASYHLRPLKELRQINEAPERTLLIVLRGAESARSPDPLDRMPNEDSVRDYVNRGGAILYASDQPKRLGWVEWFDVKINGKKVESRRGEGYQGLSYCPFVYGDKNADPYLFKPRIDWFAARSENRSALLRVACNRPSYLEPSEGLPRLAAYFPGWSIFLEGERFSRITPLQFAQGKQQPGGGRILVLADHSVFINDMLLPAGEATDNLEFAANCLDWLRVGPGATTRDRILFIDQNGQIETDFNLSLTELPPLPVKSEDIPGFLWENRHLLWEHRDKLDYLEESGFFRHLEEQDVFNRLLLWIQPHWRWIRMILAGLTMVLFIVGIRRFLGSRYAVERGVPRLTVALDRYRPRVGLLEQRLRTGLGYGLYYEAARERTRQFFADLDLAPADHGQTLPEFTIDAGWRQRRTLAADLRHAWRLAYGGEAVAVSGRQWEALERRLQNLRQAIRKGIIRLPGTPA